MIKKTYLLFLLTSISLSGMSQIELEEKKPKFKDRLYYGGNFGLAFGNITYIEISPRVGYMIDKRASVGLGGNYIYQSLTFTNSNNQQFRITNTIYGGALFGRYNITPQFFAYGEFEMLSMEFYNPRLDRVQREWVPGLLIGGGYFQPFGRRGGISIMLLYNVAYDPMRSYYPSPYVLRIGAAF